MAGATARQVERWLEAARGYLTLEMSDHALRELAQIAADGDEVEFEVSRLRGEALRQQREARDVRVRQLFRRTNRQPR